MGKSLFSLVVKTPEVGFIEGSCLLTSQLMGLILLQSPSAGQHKADEELSRDIQFASFAHLKLSGREESIDLQVVPSLRSRVFDGRL